MKLIFSLMQLKNNFYFNISDIFGKLVHSSSLGGIGFKNISKRLLINVLKLIKSLVLKTLKKYSNDALTVFLKFEGIKKDKLRKFYFSLSTLLFKNKIQINGFIQNIKIPFNGCRNPK